MGLPNPQDDSTLLERLSHITLHSLEDSLRYEHILNKIDCPSSRTALAKRTHHGRLPAKREGNTLGSRFVQMAYGPLET